MKNNNTNNNINFNNINLNNSQFVHVRKEGHFYNRQSYRISPRTGPDLNYLEGPITGPFDYLRKLFMAAITPIIWLCVTGVVLKVVYYVVSHLSDFWIAHEDGIFDFVFTLLNGGK